jgi:hypothetical protein
MRPRVRGSAAGLLSCGLASLAFACAAGDKSAFVATAFSMATDDGGNDGGAATEDSSPIAPSTMPDDAPMVDEPPMMTPDVATGGDDSGSGGGASDGGGCNAPTCAACVTGNQCCTATGTCGCTWILG